MRGLAMALALGLATPAMADCRDMLFEGASYTVCDVDPATETLRLWLRDGKGADGGAILGTFERLEELLAADGQSIGVAMNGGMYHDDRRPVGLYIEDGVEMKRIVTREGPGNFGLLPNGVFCIGEGWASVVESRRFAADPPDCRYATQSGPMLVIGGDLHPRFLPDSASLNIRNGVGVTPEGLVRMAISNEAVTFHAFARFFRDALGTPDALYLDGSVSRLFIARTGRHDVGFPMGPILGTAVPAR